MKTIKGDKTSDNLLSIPGIGKSIANDLHIIGIHHVNDLVSLFDTSTINRRSDFEIYEMKSAIYGTAINKRLSFVL